MGVKAERESDIQKAILQWLRLQGAWCVRINSGMMRWGDNRRIRLNDTPGCPDILCCWPGVQDASGVFVGIEVKRPGGKLRDTQGVQLDGIRRAGGLALVVRSVSELEAALRAEGLV